MYPNFSEFGLYRYENASSRKHKNRLGIYPSIILYSIVSMSIIFGIILYIFIGSRYVEITDSKKFMNNTKKHFNVTETNVGLEVIELSSSNSSESSSHLKRIKRLESDEEEESNDSSLSPEQQKLIFFPNRATRAPMNVQKPKIIHYQSLPPNHKLSPSRKYDQQKRPFPFLQQSTLMPRPHEYLKPPTARSFFNTNNQQVNSIQDVIHNNHRSHYPTVVPQLMQANAMHLAQSNPIKLMGKYRHPRTNVDLAQIFQQNNAHLQADATDPLQSYKPLSAYEINQMINQNINDHQMKYLSTTTSETPYFRRKFKKKVPNYNVNAKDVTNVYGNVLQSSKHVQDRNENAQGNPFSVMLDVFPLPGTEDNELQQLMQMQKLMKIRPLMSRYYQDPQVFNTMNFPQLTPRYPAYFRYQNQPQVSTHYGTIQTNGNGMMKPSQLVVHLNLYPKSNSSPTSYKRSSTEEAEELRIKLQQQQQKEEAKREAKKNQTLDISTTPLNINFNVLAGNAHPENVMFHKLREFNRTSTSTEATHSQNYFYDDDYDQSLSLPSSPSLVYKNIHRDRPIHLMLRNKNATVSSTTPKLPNTMKLKQKFKHHTIDRPRKKFFNFRPRNDVAGGPFY